MRDEHDDRFHQALRGAFAANLAQITGAVAHAFARLHGRLYDDTPWSRRAGKARTKLTAR